MERQLEKEFGDMCMVCQKSGAAFECEHCLERPFCGESCLRKHALRCTNCVGMAFGLSGRDVIASDCLTGSPIDPSKKVATAGDPDDPIATFKLHALDAVMRSPKGLGKIRKIMELASDANFAKLASPATTDYLKFDAAFVRDLEFICGMGSIAHVCRSRQKFAAALPEDCRLTMVLDASKDLQKQLRVISEGIEISDEQQLEKCYSRVRIAHIVDSATRIDLGSAHGTCTMLLDSMPTMNPPMPDDRKTKFVMDAVNALVTLPRFSRIDTIRISNIVLDSGYSAGAKKAASAAPLVRRALDRVEFVNCHFGSSIGAKELEEIAMEPANVTLLTAANISFRGMLIPFDRTLFEYMLHRDLIAKTETRMSITGMIQYDALEMLDCLMFRRNRRLILDTFEISVIVSPIKTTGCGIQTSVLPIRKLRLLQTGRPHTSEPEPILRHFACEGFFAFFVALSAVSPRKKQLSVWTMPRSVPDPRSKR